MAHKLRQNGSQIQYDALHGTYANKTEGIELSNHADSAARQAALPPR
ncbi:MULTISPECIES: hypothetical protein [unclassified Thiomonas]|nr:MULTISPECIES: hypothetical protein [unclassified Thiomonas]